MTASYTTNVTAALGATLTALGMHPLKNPEGPSFSQILVKAVLIPEYSRLTTRTSPSAVSSTISDRCWSRALTTCNGYVTVLATLEETCELGQGIWEDSYKRQVTEPTGTYIFATAPMVK